MITIENKNFVLGQDSNKKLISYPNKRWEGSGPMKDWHLFPIPDPRIQCTQDGGISTLPPKVLEKIFSYIKNPRDFFNVNLTCRYFFALTIRMYNQKDLGKLWQQQKAMRTNIDNLRGKNGFDGWINYVSETIKNLKIEKEEIQRQVSNIQKQQNELSHKFNLILVEEFKKIDASGLFVAGLLIDISQNPGGSLPDHLACYIGLSSEVKQELQAEFEKQQKVKDRLQWLKGRLEENNKKFIRQSSDLDELNRKLNSYVSRWGNNGEIVEGQYLELCKKVLSVFLNFKN